MRVNHELREIFASVGQALEAVQCIEMDLVSLYVVDAIHTGRAILREQATEMAGAWDKEMFGKLLRPLLESPHIPADMKGFLEQVRQQRNYLVHHYFKKNGHLVYTRDGRSAVQQEIDSLLRDLHVCRQVIHTSLREFAREVGITDEAIEEELRRLGVPEGWAIQ